MRLAYLRVVVRLSRTCSLAPVFAGCTAEARQLLYTVEFACEGDRELSDELLLRVFEGGCRGANAVYEAHLSKGESAPLGGAVAPGVYGFEAVAYREGAVLAAECLEADLPRSGPPVVVLQSESCMGEAGAGST